MRSGSGSASPTRLGKSRPRLIPPDQAHSLQTATRVTAEGSAAAASAASAASGVKGPYARPAGAPDWRTGWYGTPAVPTRAARAGGAASYQAARRHPARPAAAAAIARGQGPPRPSSAAAPPS
jgi:hypothetical protein